MSGIKQVDLLDEDRMKMMNLKEYEQQRRETENRARRQQEQGILQTQSHLEINKQKIFDQILKEKGVHDLMEKETAKTTEERKVEVLTTKAADYTQTADAYKAMRKARSSLPPGASKKNNLPRLEVTLTEKEYVELLEHAAKGVEVVINEIELKKLIGKK